MVASAIAIAVSGSAALAVNLGVVGGPGPETQAVLSSDVGPASTVVRYQDVYDLPPTTAVAPATTPAPVPTAPPATRPVTTRTTATTAPPAWIAPATVDQAPAPVPVATTAPAPPTTRPPTAVTTATTTTIPWWRSRTSTTVAGGWSR